MTDLFSEIALGEALVELLPPQSFKAQNAITKGDLVKMSTHTAGVIGTVTPVSADGDVVVGIALRDIPAGEYGPILTAGWVKVKACGAITLGSIVKSEYTADATPKTLVEASAAWSAGNCGIALQTFADEDEGIILLCPGH